MTDAPAHPGLRHGPLGPSALHVCVDMQRVFAPGGPWEVPWMTRILPVVERLCAHAPARTVFTRFMTPERAEDMPGTWQVYYRKWEKLTSAMADPADFALVPSLERFVPPARVVDKWVYSPWLGPDFEAVLRAEFVDTLVISGGETDVCVLATALGAVDRGLRVVLAGDALCSSSDLTHDALVDLYLRRFDTQIELAGSDEILSAWTPG